MSVSSWRNVFDVDNMFYLSDVPEKKPATILSQYASSPRIVGLINAFQQYLDANDDMDLVLYNVVDIYKATGVSLDNWGRILGISRVLYTDSEQIVWSDDEYRFLLLFKALANISSSDVATLNYLLTQLFDETVYILDNQNMTIRVVFEFYPDDEQTAILMEYGLLCRGAGVGWEWYRIDPDETFGFDGSELQPFNCGVFAPYDVVVMG